PQRNRRQQILRLRQQPCRQCSAPRLRRQFANLPFTQRKQRRLRHGKKATGPGTNQNQHRSQDDHPIHTRRMSENPARQKSKSSPPGSAALTILTEDVEIISRFMDEGEEVTHVGLETPSFTPQQSEQTDARNT